MPADMVMKEFKAGNLHSGSKTGPVVTNPAQAKAILISESKKGGSKVAAPKTAMMKAPSMMKTTSRKVAGKLA